MTSCKHVFFSWFAFYLHLISNSVSCRQVIKREDGCAIPAAGRPRIEAGVRYKEPEGDSPLPRGNQNERVSVPLTSRKQHWNDIVTFFFLVVLGMSGGI